MPLIIPKTLPAYGVLGSENVFVMHKRRARTQHIRPPVSYTHLTLPTTERV